MRLPFNGDYPVTQTFGNKLVLNGVDYYGQWGLKGHDGIDYGLPTGTPVLAPHTGTVIEANFDPNGYGNYVKIQSDTEGSVLGHLQRIDVAIGFQVKEGDPIGISNNTGASTGPHLHWGYYRIPRDRSNGYDGFIDQLPFLTNVTMNTKYKVGDTIEPTVVILVGPAPGQESEKYGKVGPHFPAKVTGFVVYNGMYYYNIDQSSLGGGTGFVRADMVDASDVYNENPPKPASPTPNVTQTHTVVTQPVVPVVQVQPPAPATPVVKTYSVAEYQALQDELNRYKNLFEDLKVLLGIAAPTSPPSNTNITVSKTALASGLDWLMNFLFNKGVKS